MGSIIEVIHLQLYLVEYTLFNLWVMLIIFTKGHDTTASAISWTLYSLAQHPEIQEKAREEVKNVLHANRNSTFHW